MRPVMHTVWGVPIPDLHEGMRHVRSRHLCPRAARGDAEPPVVPTNGKRICGVNRNADGAHYETVTLVTHASHPLAIRCCRDASGETAALLALLEDNDLAGYVLNLDTLQAITDTAQTIVETHGTDYVLAVKANCPDSFAQLATMDWDGLALRQHGEAPSKAHGRILARRNTARDLLPTPSHPSRAPARRSMLSAGAPTRRPARPPASSSTASPP